MTERSCDGEGNWQWDIKYKWGWDIFWTGWRRCLWLAVSIDFKYWSINMVIFGLVISWGRHIDYSKEYLRKLTTTN